MLLSLWVNGAPALASNTSYPIRIEAQALDQSLRLLAMQTGAQVLFSPTIVSGIENHPLVGDYTLDEALSMLLQGTNLEYMKGANDVIAIRIRPEFNQPSGRDQRSPFGLFVIEEILVTGNKLDGVLQRMPLSIMSLSSVEMDMAHINTTQELSNFVPGLQLRANAPSSGHNASSTVYIRGIGQSEFIPSSDPGVGIYVDGIYYARSVGTAIDIIDTENIEILRGPQGTLFGRNTIGGAILVHSKKPESIFGAKLKIAFESDRGIAASGTLNTPINDDLTARITLSKHHRDGYITRLSDGIDLGDDNSFFAKAGLRWSPNDKLNIDIIADYMKEEENGPPQTFAAINTQELFPILASVEAGCPGASLDGGVPENKDPRCANNQYQALGPYHVASNGNLSSAIESGGGVITLDWKSDWGNLRSITGYRKMSWFSERDADNTPLTILHTINDEQQSQFSQEINFQGANGDQRLNWLAGAYYFTENAFEDYPAIFPGVIGASNLAVKIDNRGHAFFGQLNYDFADNFTLTAGVRQTNEKKSALPFNQAYINGPGWNVPNPLSDTPSCDPLAAAEDCIRLLPGELLYNSTKNQKHYSKTTAATSLSYQLSEQTMTYISYASGFKSGGFNTRVTQPVVSPTAPTGREFLPDYEPEFAETLEIGLKSILLSDTLSLNVSLFFTNYEDMQVLTRSGNAPILTNAGESEIKGLEIEWRYSPMSDLLINGGLGLIDARYKKLSSAILDKDRLSGGIGTIGLNDQLVHTPRRSLHIGIAKTFPTEIGIITPRLDYTYQSKTYFDAANTEEIAQPGYSVTNASVQLATRSNKYLFSLAIKNITNKRYLLTGNSSFYDVSGYAESTWARPREWSFSMEYNY